MDFKIGVKEIQSAMSMLLDCSPSRSSFDGAVPLQIETKENRAVFSVIGSSSVVIAIVDVDKNVDGSLVINMHDFHSAIKALKAINEEGYGSETVRVFKGRQSLKIHSTALYSGKKTKQTRSLSILESEFKHIFIPSEESFSLIPFDPFVSSVRSVLFSISTGKEPGQSSGVVLTCEENSIKSVSTNGVSLTEFKTGLDKEIGNFSVNVSSEFISKIGKVFYKLGSKKSENDKIGVFVDGNVFWVKYKNLMVASPIQNEVFPDYSPLLVNKNNKFIISSKIFSDNIRNILFSSIKDDDFRITLKFMEDKLDIVSSTCENEGIPLEAGNTNLQIEFNGYLLDGAVRSLLSDYIVFSYKDRYSPVLLQPYESEKQLLIIVAPLR